MAITRCLTLGGAALILAAGCGPLWRPFLETVEPGRCESAEAACASPDLGVVEDLAPLGDWEVLDPGTQADLRAIWGYDGEQTIWFGGDYDNLLSWRPGSGVRKEPLPPSTKVNRIHAISGWPGNDDRGIVVAVGEPNLLVYWNGLLWKDGAPANPVGTTLTGVTMTQSGYVYASGDSGALYYGPVGGVYQVSRLGPNGLGLVVGVARADTSSVWAIVANGDIVRSYAGMNSVYTGLAGLMLYGVWAPPPLLAPGDLTLNGPSRPYVVGARGLITRADTNGRFSPEPLPDENDIVLRDRYAVTGNQLGEVWVAGQDGRLLYYDGKTWKVVPPPTGEGRSLRGIWVAPGGRKPWVVGDRGLLMRRRTPP